MKTTDAAIRAENLTKVFVAGKDKVTALDAVSLTAKSGRLTALIGADGTGKTTLMRLVAGLLRPTAGRLLVLGKDVAKEPQAVQDELSYMPQKFGLYEDLTVAENMDLYANLHGVPKETRQKRFPRLLEMTGLARFTGRQAGRLSGGMKQKLGLACTLVRAPRLLLLDEPTVGVDPLSRRELWEILKELVKGEELSVFVSTAYMDEAELCEDVLVLNAGKVLFSGTPDDLRAVAEGRCGKVLPPKGMATRTLQSALMGDTAHVVDAVPEGGAVRFIRRTADGAVPLLSRLGLTAEDVPARLEDGFMSLLREAAEAGKPAPTEQDAALPAASADLRDAPVEVAVQHLVRKFGDFTAVANTSFDVRRGEVFGLLGPNGAGKTTTFRMLCGLLPATSGTLSVAGVNLRTARTKARAKIGYVAQKFSLYGKLSVRENLRFFGGVYGLPDAALARRIEEVMDEFGLRERENEVAEELPGGYKQRLSMAAALLHQPGILFLDEPTSGIDPLARRQFWQQITALSAAGTTIIITTHFMEEAEYCDRIMIQDQGKLLAIGSPAEIRERLGRTGASMNEIFIAIVEEARAKEAAP